MRDSLPDVEGDEECARFGSCAKCTRNPKCGWCVLEERCVRGDNISPLNTLCNFYNYQYCAGKACARYLDCDVRCTPRTTTTRRAVSATHSAVGVRTRCT